MKSAMIAITIFFNAVVPKRVEQLNDRVCNKHLEVYHNVLKGNR